MASNLLRNLTKTNLVKQRQFYKNQNRLQTGGPSIQPVSPPQPPPSSNNSSSSSTSLPLVVGLSLGLGLGAVAQSSILDRILPKSVPQPPTQPTPAYDPKIVQELINATRRINQLENDISNLRSDTIEREKMLAQTQSREPVIKANGNVFELSQVIEANNMAHLKRQKRELEDQRKALIREHQARVEGEILKVENKYKPVINRIKQIEQHLETLEENHRKEAPARLLWLTCQQLLDRLRCSPETPLENDPAFTILKQFAADNNPLATSVIDSIPVKALKSGVPSEESLISRFSKVDKICKRVALVGENGGGLKSYLLSYLQSLFIFAREVPEDEVTGKQLVDPTSWHTFDILARVRLCLERRNLEQALRYANQLRGQARFVAKDWICDARTYLEVRQAFRALSTHAEATAVASA